MPHFFWKHVLYLNWKVFFKQYHEVCWLCFWNVYRASEIQLQIPWGLYIQYGEDELYEEVEDTWKQHSQLPLTLHPHASMVLLFDTASQWDDWGNTMASCYRITSALYHFGFKYSSMILELPLLLYYNPLSWALWSYCLYTLNTYKLLFIEVYNP